MSTHERYRRPAGNELGLKTLKRVAFLGRNYVDRFFFRDAPSAKVTSRIPSKLGLDIAQEEASNGIQNQTPSDQDVRKSEIPGGGDTLPRHARGMMAWDHDNIIADTIGVCSKRMPGPYTDVGWLRKNKSYLYSANVESLDRLGQFEAFMRHVEVWRLHVSGHVTYVFNAKSDACLTTYSAFHVLSTLKGGETFLLVKTASSAPTSLLRCITVQRRRFTL